MRWLDNASEMRVSAWSWFASAVASITLASGHILSGTSLSFWAWAAAPVVSWVLFRGSPASGSVGAWLLTHRAPWFTVRLNFWVAAS